MPTPVESADPERLLEWWSAQWLDVGFLPTPLAEHAWQSGVSKAQVRTLLVGGDRLRRIPEDLEFSLVNNYGPTEATVVATSGRVEPGTQVISIGRPIGNTQIYILDGEMEAVPVGVVGESISEEGSAGYHKARNDRGAFCTECVYRRQSADVQGRR
jgi:non-ribosomal peptide synthetase component F